MVMDKEFQFFITHVEAEKQFLKIWAQTSESLYSTITALLRSLQEKFDYYGPSASSINLAPGTRCVARAMNNIEFHRVKVINLRSDGMVLVQFMDYGRISFVPIINIRTTEEIPEAQELFALPDAATPFFLEGVLPIGGTWMDGVLTQIASVLTNKRFIGFSNTFNNIKTLKFCVMNEDFAQTLVNRNMAVYSSTFIPDMVHSISISAQPLRTPHLVGGNQEQWRINPASSPKVLKTRSFKAIQLEVGDFYNIKISHIEDGPSKFSVQLLETLPYLDAMMKKINSQSHKPLQEPPIAGTVCLGRQTHPINRLCRIVLNSPGDTSCKVYYADYGHHETLSFGDIYQIPDEFISENIFSIRFTLSGIADWKISQEMKDYFQNLVWDKSLKIKVCKGPMSPLTQYCDLYLQDQSVKEMLLKAFPGACELVYPEAKQLPVGSKEEVYVTFVESTSKFFVQLEKDYKLLDDLMAQIESYSKIAPRINSTQLQNATSCIALYDQDNKWYRASVITKIDHAKVKVLYVDYGNEEIVNTDNLRAISPDLVIAVKKQAIKCSLHLPGISNPELDRIFEDLVIDKRLILKIINYSSNVAVVELYDDQNVPGIEAKSIAKLLLNDTPKIQEIPMTGRYVDKNTNSMYKPPQTSPRNQKFDPKAQSHVGQKQPKLKNKNLKTRDTWTNQPNSHDNLNTKFRKDNENENRLRNGPQQNNSFDRSHGEQKRFNQNDRFDRNRVSPGNDSNRSRGNSVLGSDYSDRDSDASSRSGGRKNVRNERRDNDVRKDRQQGDRDKPWEHESYNGEQRTYLPPKANKNNQASTFDQKKTPGVEKLKSPVVQEKKLPGNLSTLSSKFPPPNITIGAIKDCIIVYYNKPSSFYLQLCPDNQELFALMEKISSVYEKNNDNDWTSSIEPGRPCIAQYSADNQWYRALIKSVVRSSATVHFIDYGNVETVSFSKVKEIDPEFLKLPAQAVHCQLFGCKISLTSDESSLLYELTDGKDLEAEFVTKDNDIYYVLLKQAKSGDSPPDYINFRFANEVDIIEKKNAIRNKSKNLPRRESVISPDYAPLNSKWKENTLYLGTRHNVTVSWFISPNDFYCQVNNEMKQFREMMTEIQNTYAERSPISSELKVGDSVIAILASDGVFYRAQIIKSDRNRGHVVQYVDYGDCATVDLKKIYPVEKKFMRLPKQAIWCSLKNVAPVSSSVWSDSPVLQDIFQADSSLSCFILDRDDNKYLVTLETQGTDIGSILVDKNLAINTSAIAQKATEDPSVNLVDQVEKLTEEIPRIDIKLLEGQILDVKISNVESVKKFYVQFHTAESSQAVIDSYMSTKMSEVMPRLLSHEVCVGAGCLIYFKRKWRRGVVIKIIKANCDIRLIDSGEHKRFSLKDMMNLPGPLSAMQNQAIECELFDVSLSGTASEILKTTIIPSQTVKIFVEKVEQNKLSVRLFDIDGNKIKLIESQCTESISPVCSPQILTSTHEVVVTWINNSSSLWLQRSSDSPLEEQLLNSMYDYYSQIVEQVTPVKNELFAGLSSDGNWYRVKILEILNTDVKVLFIDYGNIETISVNNLCTLKPEFYQPYQLGIEVSLTVSLVGKNNEQIDILEPLVKDKTLTATFYNVRRKWVAELSENGEKLSEKLTSMNLVAETKKVEQFIVPEVEEMVVGGKYNVRISHIIDSREVLWLHRVEELSALKDLQANLQKLASETELTLNIDDLQENSLCLALNSCDKVWRRAKVYSIDEDVTVQFIDYGNMDAIELGSNGIKMLPDEWKSIKMFGIPCKLDVMPVNDDYNNEVCDRIMSLMNSGVPLKALIISDKAPMSIDLYAEGQSESFCSKLIKDGFATNAVITEEVSEEDTLLEEEIPRDPRSTYVCCSTSVDEFWVQDDKWVNDLQMIEDRLMMSSVLGRVTEIKEGLVCIAQFPDDDKYYRATILSHGEEGTEVQFMDYGNIAFTNDLRVIPEDLSKIRPLSRKCRLAKPEGIDKWPEDVNDKFTELSAYGATVFLREVLEEGETCVVKLIYEGKDVALELLKMCQKPMINKEETTVKHVPTVTSEERPPPIGQENFHSVEKCGVSYVKSLSNFWINKVQNYVDIESIADEMEHGDDFAAVTEVKEGKILAALYSGDNIWYRSKVVSRDDEGTTVLFIDYGNTQLIKEESDLRELPTDLVLIPPMAHHCCVKMPENFKESASVIDKFLDLIDGGNTEFEVSILDKSKQPMLVLLRLDEEDVIDILRNQTRESLNDSKKSEDSGIHTDNVNDPLKNSSSTDTLEVSPKNNESMMDKESFKTDLVQDKLPDDMHPEELTTPTVRQTGSPSSDDKIVPGSVSRGISVEEIDRYRPTYRTASPDDRILPGSCNQGVVENVDPSESNQKRQISKFETPKNRIETSVPRTPIETVSYDDKPVPGSVSRGESPIQERPETPKIAHADKLVSGVVNPPRFDPNVSDSWE